MWVRRVNATVREICLVLFYIHSGPKTIYRTAHWYRARGRHHYLLRREMVWINQLPPSYSPSSKPTGPYITYHYVTNSVGSVWSYSSRNLTQWLAITVHRTILLSSRGTSGKGNRNSYLTTYLHLSWVPPCTVYTPHISEPPQTGVCTTGVFR